MVAATGSVESSLSVSDTFRVSFSHGNQGLGNGQDAPLPVHKSNWNDGPGTSPGIPGSATSSTAVESQLQSLANAIAAFGALARGDTNLISVQSEQSPA